MNSKGTVVGITGVKAWVVMGMLFVAGLLGGLAAEGATRSTPRQLPPLPPVDIPRLPTDLVEKMASALNPVGISLGKVKDPFTNRAELVNYSPVVKTGMSAIATAKPEGPDFYSRYTKWQNEVATSVQRGENPRSVASVYLRSELDPVGITEASGKRFALFSIKPENRVMSMPVGTVIFDATLEQVNGSGVVWLTKSGSVKQEWVRNKSASANVTTAPPVQPPSLLPLPPQSSGESDDLRFLQQAVKDRYSADAYPMPILEVGPSKPDDQDLLLDKFIEGGPLGDVSNQDGQEGVANKSQSAVVGTGDRKPQVNNDSDKSDVPTFCDEKFSGDRYTLSNSRAINLIDLLEDLHAHFGINFVLDHDSQEVQVRISVDQAPWPSILRTILEINDLGAVCRSGGIVQIATHAKLAKLEDEKRKGAPIEHRVFHLKYLQQTVGSRVNIAGQPQIQTGDRIASLEEAIRGVLRADGDQRADVRRIPGRNDLIVAGTEKQIQDVADLISRVDQPSFQVQVKAVVYTVDENKLRDVGSQLSAIVGNGKQTVQGGISSLPNSPKGGTTNGSTGTQSSLPGLQPGGIPGLPTNFLPPGPGLSVSVPGAVGGLTWLTGSAQFAYQLTLASQNAIAKIVNHPFGTVSDGQTLDLDVGTQIPVVGSAIAGGAVTATSQPVQFLEASRIIQVTPQVALDDKGNPTVVSLQVRIENNSVNTSLPAFQGLPALDRQSLQTVIVLRPGETAVIGGLAQDSVSNAVNKVPGLGSLPVIGNLFKRNTDQVDRSKLYFGISVEVVPQGTGLPGVAAPADATTDVPPPPVVKANKLEKP